MPATQTRVRSPSGFPLSAPSSDGQRVPRATIEIDGETPPRHSVGCFTAISCPMVGTPRHRSGVDNVPHLTPCHTANTNARRSLRSAVAAATECTPLTFGACSGRALGSCVRFEPATESVVR